MSGPGNIVVPLGSRDTLAVIVRRALGESHSRVKDRIARGDVRVDGAVETDPASRPAPGSLVDVAAAPGTRRRATIEGPGFRVVHLDAAVIVAEKDSGVLTIPTGGGEDPGDLALVARVASALRLAGHRVKSLWVVHRIDRETSGLVAIARGTRAADALRAQFRAHAPAREYLAWCSAVPDPASGTLENRLVEPAEGGRVRVAGPGEIGREARLSYEVEARSANGARVRVRLDTGRRNQVRVQFASRGWPLVGDTWYGRGESPPGRTALHAARLRFDHPVTGRPLDVRSRPAADLLALDRSLFRPREGRLRGS